MKCPVCRATYRIRESSIAPCHRCGADLTLLIELYDRSIAHHRKSIDLFIAGDYPEAMIENNKAIALHSQYPAFHAFAGQLWAIMGEFEQGVRSWKIAQKLDPQNKLVNECLEMLDRH